MVAGSEQLTQVAQKARTAAAVTRVTAAALVVGSLVFELSCGGEPEPETPQALMPTATASSAAPATATQTTAAPTSTAPPTSPIAPIEPALAQAAQAVLEQVAKEEAPPGAKPVGMPKVSLLGTGQVSEM